MNTSQPPNGCRDGRGTAFMLILCVAFAFTASSAGASGESGKSGFLATRPALSRQILSAGVGIRIPASWATRAYAPTGIGAIPFVLQIGSFRLPQGDDDFGRTASRRMGNGDIRIVFNEFPSVQARRGQFRQLVPPLEVRPNAFFRSKLVPANHVIARQRFSLAERPFTMFVEFGTPKPTQRLIEQANQVLATLTVAARPSATAIDWRVLRRQIRLPRLENPGLCSRSAASRSAPNVYFTLGKGPAYAVIGSSNGVADLRDDIMNGRRYLHKTLWAVSDRYPGPLLIRAVALATGVRLRFTGGRLELQFPPQTPGRYPSWRYFPTYIVLPGPGCYGLQVDGTTFTETIVFEARR